MSSAAVVIGALRVKLSASCNTEFLCLLMYKRSKSFTEIYYLVSDRIKPGLENSYVIHPTSPIVSNINVNSIFKLDKIQSFYFSLKTYSLVGNIKMI